MRVLIVCSYKEKMPEGCVPFIREQVAAIRDYLNREDCRLEIGDRRLENEASEVAYYHIKGKGVIGYLREIPTLRRRIKEWKPDVVHAHYGLSCLVANLATRRVPVVSTYHGSDINESMGRKFSRIAMSLSVHNIFVSQRIMDIAHATHRADSSLIPCGVELSEGQLMTREEARKALGWSDEEKKVLFAGAFDNAVKDPELAKAVIEYINKNIDKHCCAEINIDKQLEVTKNAHSTSVSSDSPHGLECNQPQVLTSELAAPVIANTPNMPTDESHVECLQKTIISDNPQKTPKTAMQRVELIELKGYTREQVNRLMCAVNALLMTSKTEGSPQVIKEAMACGCPIVSVDAGDVAERTDGVYGCYVVGSRDPKDIAAALRKAIAFDGKTNGREKIIEYGLSNDMVAKRIIKIYEQILNV